MSGFLLLADALLRSSSVCQIIITIAAIFNRYCFREVDVNWRPRRVAFGIIVAGFLVEKKNECRRGI